MTTPTTKVTTEYKVTTISSDNNHFDIERGGGSGSIDISTTAPTFSMRPPSERTQLLPVVTSNTTARTTNDKDMNENSDTTISSDNDAKDASTTVERSSTAAASTPAAPTEAIPASSIQQTALSGFAGLGCTSIPFCVYYCCIDIYVLVFVIWNVSIKFSYIYFALRNHIVSLYRSCNIIDIDDDRVFFHRNTASRHCYFRMFRADIVTIREISTRKVNAGEGIGTNQFGIRG